MKENNKPISEGYEVYFEKFDDMQEFLKKKDRETLWHRAAISDTSVHSLAGGEMTLPDIASKLGVTASMEAILSVGDISKDDRSHTVLRARTKDGNHHSWLLSMGAYDDLTDRFGAKCALFSKLSHPEQLEFLNKAPAVLDKKELLVQFLDEKLWSCHGPNYVILPPYKLIDAADAEIKKLGSVSFEGGIYSHAFTRALWKLENDALIEEYKEDAFVNSGLFIYDDFYAEIEFCTSDIGDAQATLTPYLTKEKEKRINIGNPIKLRHSGASSVEKWKDEIKGIYANFKSSVENLKALNKIEVRYPVICAMNIARDLDISQDCIQSVCNDFEEVYANGGNAAGVFMLLQEAVFMLEAKDRAKNTSGRKNPVIEAKKEELTRLLLKSFKWTEYDVREVFQAKKGKKAFRKASTSA